MLVTKQFLVPMSKNIMDVNGNWTCLVTNILQNIFFYVLQNKESDSGLEWYEGQQIITEF